MADQLPTLDHLYPDATSNAILRGHRPPRPGINARAWSNFVFALGSGVLVTFLLVVIAEKVFGPEAVNSTFGGSGVTYDYDGDADALAGTWLKPWLFAAVAIAAVTYGLLRMALKSPFRRDSRQPWEQWAHDRGFVPARGAAGPDAVASLQRFDPMRAGRDRDWKGPFVGRAGEHDMCVGATAWTTGSGKRRERHHATFAYVRLAEHVADVFPSSSVTHFLRGFSDFELSVGGDPLRLESIDVDHNLDIRVDGGDPLDWRTLFDPTFILALSEDVDVQWQQDGNHLLFCAGGFRIGTAAVETLDTMCAGAAYVAHCYEAAAMRARAERQAG